MMCEFSCKFTIHVCIVTQLCEFETVLIHRGYIHQECMDHNKLIRTLICTPSISWWGDKAKYMQDPVSSFDDKLRLWCTNTRVAKTSQET